MALKARLQRWEKPLWMALVVALFCVPLFMGLGGKDLDNDEAIYAYAVDSILETGDWLNPRSSPNPHVVFLEKPPLKFWLVALPMRIGLLPHNEFGFRFLDALFGSVAFLYVFALGRRLAGPSCGLFALVVLCSIQPLWFDHGLRGNVMEASLVLAYCGGIFHFLRWSESADLRTGRRHALAVGLYFVLGFMTKFVAILFLPVVLGVTGLLVPAISARIRREWRLWTGAAALAVALILPWFVYQAVHAGHWLWDVMIAEHVVQRMSATLVPEHLHPWDFYVSVLFERTSESGAFWLAAAGGMLLVLGSARKRWPEAVIMLVWFAVPLTAISLGTSKLEYYLYPFLPPFALAGGYLLCWIRDTAYAPVDRAVTVMHQKAARLRAPAFLRVIFVVVGSVAVIVAFVSLIYGGFELRLGSVRLLSNRTPLRPMVLALVLGILGARTVAIPRAALVVALMMLLPITQYRATLSRTAVVQHALLSAKDCVIEVRDRERRAGRATPELLAAMTATRFRHPFFFYMRGAGFVWADPISDERLATALHVAGQQRPILMPIERYAAYLEGRVAGPTLEPPGANPVWAVPMTAVEDWIGRAQALGAVDTGLVGVYLLLPGPYAACNAPSWGPMLPAPNPGARIPNPESRTPNPNQ